MPALPAYEIGTTLVGLASLSSLGIAQIPKADPVDYAEYVNKGNGTSGGVGWLTCAWRFAVLTVAELDILDAFEGACFIRTLTHAGLYTAYSAIMVLPPRQSPLVDYYSDYVVVYRALVAA